MCCCCHPILGGSLGASEAAALLPLDPSNIPGAPPSWELWPPSPFSALGCPLALEEREWWGPGWNMKLQGGKRLNFWRNVQFVVISPLPAYTTLLGWEPNSAQVGLGNKCILEQGFKSPFQGAKRLPEVMLSPGCRR